MRRLRATWIQRGLALLLVGSLLPASLVGPSSPDVQRSVSDTHADWLRAQVRTSMSAAERAAFEAALEAATEARPHALRTFLQHFVAAYVDEGGGAASLAALLGLSDGSHEHVVNELQRRRAHLTGWAVVPRLSTLAVSVPATARGLLTHGAAVLGETRLALRPLRRVGTQPLLRDGANGLAQILSALRPRAP